MWQLQAAQIDSSGVRRWSQYAVLVNNVVFPCFRHLTSFYRTKVIKVDFVFYVRCTYKLLESYFSPQRTLNLVLSDQGLRYGSVCSAQMGRGAMF